MSVSLTELKDEPLGKHPGAFFDGPIFITVLPPCSVTETEQDVVAAAHVRSFTFDVDGLSDEVLDPGYTAAPSHARPLFVCMYQGGCQSPDTGGCYGAGSSDAKSHLMHR